MEYDPNHRQVCLLCWSDVDHDARFAFQLYAGKAINTRQPEASENGFVSFVETLAVLLVFQWIEYMLR